MIHAFNNAYLDDAQILLANAFDYALIDCQFEPTFFEKAFSLSKTVREYERGNPNIISGRGAVEFIKDIFSPILPEFIFPKASFSQDRSAAYWAGWSLAYYQWETAKSFKDIFLHVPLLDVLSMYKLHHEMDISNFVEDMNERYNSVVFDTKLKKIREARGLSQIQLAKLAGVNKRSIQLYEQRVNDIDKAQSQTLYKISRILGCSIEDLLENPEQEA